MLVQKGHKVQLLPNNEQKTVFKQWAGVARWAYNWGLERRIGAYEETGKSPRAYALAKKVVQLKHTTHPWLADVSKSVPRVALCQLDDAYTNFFRRVKNGDAQKGFPKFRSKKLTPLSFHLELNQVCIKGKRVRLPKIGWVRMAKPLRFIGKLVGTIRIGEYAGKWYVSFNVGVEVEPADNQGEAIGIDLGIKALATLSNGVAYKNPKALKRYEKLLVRAQRQLARKQMGSKRREKAKLRVRCLHKRIRDIRTNAIHQATADITKQYSFVAMEDLNVSGIVRNRRLTKALTDASFSEFKRQIQYKLNWNSRDLILIDRWFPSSKLCSECSYINNRLTLADREWTCFNCGTHHHRDHNAAINILTKALQASGGSNGAARGGLEAVGSPGKREAGSVNKPCTCELTQA